MSAHREAWSLDWSLSYARRKANEIRSGNSYDAAFNRGYALGVTSMASTICYGDPIATQAVENEARFLMHDYSRRTA